MPLTRGRPPAAVLRRLGEGMALLPAWLRSLAQAVGATVRATPAQGNYPFPGFDRLGYAEVQAPASGGAAGDDAPAGRPPGSPPSTCIRPRSSASPSKWP